jgi:pyruvate/2-oxoglutarate dehydrogenase complex dihydrolipoamide acyltransferase (E2) component
VREALRRAQGRGAAVPNAPTNAPEPDFSKYGPVQHGPLSRIAVLSGARLARNWATIPHVTNFDEADVTESEPFRRSINDNQHGAKVTLLAFLIKASVAALKQFRNFNASLGDVGGAGFTPIIDAPELAILGVARAALKHRWAGAQFRPRLILPLCLSWDHRAVDGAQAARFLGFLAATLADFRRVIL